MCEQLEQASGKRKDKWGQARHERRMNYLRQVFADARFRQKLRYGVFHQVGDFDAATVVTIAKAISWRRPTGKYTTTVYVDGLSKTKRREYSLRLRRLHLPVRHVRGVARDESDALTRLADAIAGFVRDALEGEAPEVEALFEKVRAEGVLVELGE